MYADRIVLCGASAYEQKYYFNPDFDALPQQVKEELQILCVMYTEEIGGILTLEFDEDGNLEFKTEALDADAMYDEIDSTNTQIKRLAEEDAPHGTLAVADYQSKGKGRRGHAWDSPHGSAIYMSILFRPDIRPDRASMLTLVIGLSVAQAIRSNLGVQAQIKWPNDIVLNGKKLVGILTEMSAQMNYIEYLVTGIGINASLREFPEELADKATSLQKEIGHKVNRSALIAECMKKIEENYETFVKTQDLSGMMEAYQEVLVNQDQQVRVLEPGHEYTGIAIGINAMGELLVEREDGTITEVYAGEVSVRGLYGYV